MGILRLIVLVLIFNIYLNAGVILRAPNSFISGEPYVFEYELSGSSVNFPKIEKIDQYIVEGLGTSKSLQIINGSYSEKVSKKYRIFPTSDFTIPSFDFEIDGKLEKSEEKKVTKSVALKTKSQQFDLTIQTDKKELFVGESTVLKLVFKYKRDLQITNLGFTPPHFENFWYKKLDNKNNRYEQNGYIVQELEYLLFPQKVGKLKVNPLKVDVQMIDSASSNSFGFFSAVPKVTKVYSNELNFEVKPLPQGVSLIGDFDIKALVDKTKVKQGESISYKLVISGFGNFDDIQDKKLNVKDAIVYDNKPKVETNYENDRYKGTYEKVYSIVPSNSIIIPSQSISYFDKQSQKVVTKKTQEFKIEVENSLNSSQEVVLEKAKDAPIIKKDIIETKTSNSEKVIYFVLGIVFSLLIFGLLNLVKIKKNKNRRVDTPLIKQVKSSKDKQELLKVLVPFINKDEILDELIYKCEKEGEFSSLKKDIISTIKNLKL
jgi:hypothetical protein